MNSDYKYSEITEKIIGLAMKVHSSIGNGFPESIYQRCLEIEFEKNSIPYQKEIEMKVFYDGKVVGKRRVDFIIEEKVVVELKAISRITDVETGQVLNYLKAFKKEVGLLLNFGEKSLRIKRFALYDNFQKGV